MPASPFPAWYTERLDAPPALREITTDLLSAGDVLIRVEYSDLNYKDALALTGRGKILRNAPIVPGIDLAGTVEESTNSRWVPGDRVFVTGNGLGEAHSGGYARYARAPAEWLMPIPAGFDARRVMAMGTAGLTAALCVLALERFGVKPSSGPAIVTGATGGVGSVAVALLAAAGYEVAAITGRREHEPWLRELGASSVVPRERLSELKRPLEKAEWAAAVDTVGGKPLAGLLASMKPGGAVAACGLAASATFESSVFPFILRGVALLGVESVQASDDLRRAAWDRLAQLVPWDRFERIITEITLPELATAATELLDGKRWGRIVVKI